MKKWLLHLPRQYKRVIQLLSDVVLIWLAIIISLTVRMGWTYVVNEIPSYQLLFLVAPLICLPIFIRLGLYRAVLRYVSTDFFITIIKAVTLSSLVLALFIYWFGKYIPLVPRSLVFNYWWSSIFLIMGSRAFIRHYFLGDWLQIIQGPFYKKNPNYTRVLIYGAGSAGKQLVTALRMGLLIEPVAFIDDDPNIVDASIDGLRIYDSKHIQKAMKQTEATELLLAIPSASRARRQEIIAYLSQFPIRVRTIPGFTELVNGKVKVQDLQEIDIADLLGRDPVLPHKDLFEFCIKNQNIMVTGAGGSIGSELCRQILQSNATSIILFENSEYNLYTIATELTAEIQRYNRTLQLIPILGSVQDERRLYETMIRFDIDTVYHAAAYKHVPIVEENITQGIANNIFGTLYTAKAALNAKVKNFVLISTDKAVRPTNVMGATKRLAEMILQALSTHNEQQPTRFTMVRFGNVLNSSGSVIPLFRKQIQEGSVVTVTHPEITRYFMTIPEAAELVIQAGSLGQGGDVFVLDMGKPVKIIDLATKMIQLSGLTIRNSDNLKGDIEIQFTGLRAGEKLYEELLIGDNVTDTEHPMIMRANEDMIPWLEMENVLEALKEANDNRDYDVIKALLLQYISGYHPQNEIVDHLYHPA